MSIHAYRVVKLSRAKVPSFNIFVEEALIDFITMEQPANPPQIEGVCMLDVQVTTLEKALKKVKLSATAKEAIQQDIEWAKERGETVLLYDVF